MKNKFSVFSVVLLSLAAALPRVSFAEMRIKTVDISGEKHRHSIVAAGTPELYQGHPTTALLSDGKTMFCFWPVNHGGHSGSGAMSTDAGRTWSRIDEKLPAGMRYFVECPMTHVLTDKKGKSRIWVWGGFKALDEKGRKSSVGSKERIAAASVTKLPMPSIMSDDGGKTWKEMPSLGEKFRCVLSFQAMTKLKNGDYLGIYHRGPVNCVDRAPLELLASTTSDGGFTWSDPVVIAPSFDGLNFCEPWITRSPDGKELAILIRENSRKGRSKVIFSRDEGATWTKAVDVPAGLTGDRHQGVMLPDGRMVVCFRDMDKGSKTKGHYVAWVGPYDALHGKGEGYLVKLFHCHGGWWDVGYSGVHLLADGTIVCTTYTRYLTSKNKPSVVTTRFKVSETDSLAAGK